MALKILGLLCMVLFVGGTHGYCIGRGGLRYCLINDIIDGVRQQIFERTSASNTDDTGGIFFDIKPAQETVSSSIPWNFTASNITTKTSLRQSSMPQDAWDFPSMVVPDIFATAPGKNSETEIKKFINNLILANIQPTEPFDPNPPNSITFTNFLDILNSKGVWPSPDQAKWLWRLFVTVTRNSRPFGGLSREEFQKFLERLLNNLKNFTASNIAAKTSVIQSFMPQDAWNFLSMVVPGILATAPGKKSETEIKKFINNLILPNIQTTDPTPANNITFTEFLDILNFNGVWPSPNQAKWLWRLFVTVIRNSGTFGGLSKGEFQKFLERLLDNLKKFTAKTSVRQSSMPQHAWDFPSMIVPDILATAPGKNSETEIKKFIDNLILANIQPTEPFDPNPPNSITFTEFLDILNSNGLRPSPDQAKWLWRLLVKVLKNSGPFGGLSREELEEFLERLLDYLKSI